MIYKVTDDLSLNIYIVTANSEKEAVEKIYNKILTKHKELVEENESEDGITFNFEYYTNTYGPKAEEIKEDVHEIVIYS